MEWGINDSLKSRSYGLKNDYDDKLSRKGSNYYPQGADGNVDEWSALSRQQQELVKKDDKEQKERNEQQK